MRFLTAFFCNVKVASSFDWFATHDRAPIKVLVEALEQLRQ
jgi:hypothetical protein